MQSPEKVKSLSESPDQVVLLMERPNPKPKQSQSPPKHTDSDIDQNKTTTITTTTRTLRRLQFSKPKSRFHEFKHPHPLKPIPSTEDPDPAWRDKPKPNWSDDDDHEDDDDLLKKEEEEILQAAECLKRKKRKVRWRVVAEWATFVIIMACLVTSRTVGRWKKEELWGLALWKWGLMALVVFSGRLVSGWVLGLMTFLIERNFMLREKVQVLYFVYALRKSVRNCVWLGLVLLAWYVTFNPEIEGSTRNHRILWRVWRALIAVTIGAVMWLVKIILVKVLASSFHVVTFFDRMKESVFHHIILEKLSVPPVEEAVGRKGAGRGKAERLTRKVVGGVVPTASRRIDMEILRRLSREKPSGLGLLRKCEQSHVQENTHKKQDLRASAW